jgi:hypothetical protein
MDTASTIIALLKELGTLAITVIGFGWVLFNLRDVKKDVSDLRVEVKKDISDLRVEVSDLRADVKSIKNNHLPHIEAAIKELAKGTLNEEHVKAILDLSHEPDIGK